VPYSEEWGDLTYHLSKPRLSTKSSLTELLKNGTMGLLPSEIPSIDDVHGDAKAMLNRQRMLWSKHLHQNTSNSSLLDGGSCEGSCSDSSSDEGYDFTSQRNLIRNKSQHVKPDQSQHHRELMQRLDNKSKDSDSFDEEDTPEAEEEPDDSADSSSGHGSSGSSKKDMHTRSAHSRYVGSDTASVGSTGSSSRYMQRARGGYRASPGMSMAVGSSDALKLPHPPFPSPTLTRFGTVVEIRDYDFDRRNIIIPAGAPVEFRLHPKDVPLHVEHVLEGRSICAELCFTSPILQVKCPVCSKSCQI
jgi:hypothetical protein